MTHRPSVSPPWASPWGPRLALLPLALAVIWAGTAVPTEIGHAIVDRRLWRTGAVDVVANLILYLPLGVALRKRRWWVAAAAAGALSAAMETLQLWYPDRCTALTDLAANICGALIGYAISRAGDRRWAWGFDPLAVGGRMAAAGLIVFAAGASLLSLPGTPADFSNWRGECRLVAGNEVTGDRPWKGEIEAVAVFDRSFAPREIARLSALDPRDVRDSAPRAPVYFQSAPSVLDSLRGEPLLDDESREEFFEALTGSGRLAVMVWFTTASERQFGPARIFGYSEGPYSHNFTLAQEGRDIIFRVRTPTTNPGGFYPQTRASGVIRKETPAVAAAAYDGRSVRVYMDGRLEARLNLGARGKLSPYFADIGLPMAAVMLGMAMSLAWVRAAWPAGRPSLVAWGAVGGLLAGAVLALGGGADAVPEFAPWVPVLAAWGGGVAGASCDESG